MKNKTQNKKKIGLADKVVKKAKEKSNVKPLNPFEVKINKQKFNILGRPTKHERGLPGVSRNKAIKKRQTVLLPEYKNRFKSNKFVDRRLGENNPSLTLEGKMAMRFAVERLKTHNKKSKFNLGEDEILTHRGQTLADVEKFDDPRSDTDEEDNEKLKGSFVSGAHFGGGILKKVDESEEVKQNRESLIDNLIAESKRRKEEKQKDKEETDDLTDKLDENYKDLLDLLSVNQPSKKSDSVQTKLPDTAYDTLVRELKFDARSKPTDKLKSEEEMARIEKEKLEKLEAERISRMKGNFDTKKQIPHRSADDLDDGFWHREEKNNDNVLTFPLETRDETPTVECGNGAVSESEGGSDEESEAEDSFSDLASSSDEEEILQQTDKNRTQKTSRNKKDNIKKTNEGVPFVFKIPVEYDEFNELMTKYEKKQQRIVLERMIKCNHPSLSENNKSSLERLFTFILQYIHETIATNENNLSIIDELTSGIYDLTQLLPSNTVASMILDVLAEKREEFSSRGGKRPVSLATLLFLKLAALIFPTSDFRHPVTTPAFHLLVEVLLCTVSNLETVKIGLGLCALAYEYVSLSKRYIPEVAHYLHGLIQLAIPRSSGEPALALVSPFRPVGTESQLLVLDGNDNQSSPPGRIQLTTVTFDNHFRISATYTTVQLLKDFLGLWSELAAAPEIFSPIKESLQRLPLQQYHADLSKAVENLIQNIEQLGKIPRKRLMHEAKKPKLLRLYEPVFEDSFDGRKKRFGSKEKLEKEKLQHKLKREMKGAIREIRRDNSFLARQQLKDQLQRDAQRKRKVKELLSSLAVQESEVRKMKKQKRK